MIIIRKIENYHNNSSETIQIEMTIKNWKQLSLIS